MSIEYYELNPSYYVSASSLSWDGMFKMTGVRIELFTDMAMHDFTEKAKCDDVTNLYGHSMGQYLPIGNYQWEASRKYLLKNPAMQKKYLEKILNTRFDAKRGYFLNINTHFSLKTHEYLKDLPPAVKNVALQYYVKLGMVVDEVSEILSFDQTNWLEPYITFNTEKRNKAKKAGNTFLSDFFKLMNISVYSKTMENVRKYQDVKIMKKNNERDKKAFLKKVCKPSFKYARQLGNTFIGAHMEKASVTLNKSIIEKYGDKAKLRYMDTDFYIFETETEDIYKDMAERPDLFNLNGDQTVRKFKDETPGVSKKSMSEMATDSYMPTLEGSLLDNSIDKSLLSERETRDLAMQSEADPMSLVYWDCLFDKKVFYAKDVGI
uniref:DNA-directed DNA polymerase n=1 Tax=Rhizophagus irregularis (strain DAOM 181602 / DAOM 197198 / MUCL 43194) TaxID=747089 RepID=U9SPY4_RHIID